MGRPATVRWKRDKALWCSDCGEPTVDARGRARRRTVYFPGPGRRERAAAEELLRAHLKARREAEERAAGPIDDPTVDQVALAYLAHSAEHRAPRTTEGHREVLKAFCAFRPDRLGPPLGLRPARSVGSADLEAILQAWRKQDRSPHYAGRLCRSVKACWAWAAGPGRLLTTNPMKPVKPPMFPRAPERTCDRGELARFLRFAWRDANSDRRDYPGGRCAWCLNLDRPGPCRRPHNPTARMDRAVVLLVRLAAHTGCRPGELTRLAWDQFEPDTAMTPEGHPVAAFVQHRHKTSGRTGKPRVIIVPPALRRALLRLRHRPGRHPTIVFTHKRGRGAIARGVPGPEAGQPWSVRPLTRKLRNWREKAIAAGVPLTPDGDKRIVLYLLRHDAASRLLRRGHTGDQVAALLGTSARIIESHYGHFNKSSLADIARDLQSRDR